MHRVVCGVRSSYGVRGCPHLAVPHQVLQHSPGPAGGGAVPGVYRRRSVSR